MNIIDDYLNALNKVCDQLKFQLEMIDDISLGSSEQAFFAKLIGDLKSLDSREVALNSNPELILQDLQEEHKIEVRDGMIFTRVKGLPAMKKMLGSVEDIDRRRRMSFAASASCYDQGVFLRVEKLDEMTDLNFLFSMNGYHLPYCESTNQRSQYESFFAAYLKKAQSSQETLNFSILREGISTLYITTEFCIDTIECILEMAILIETRIKMINMKSSTQIRFECESLSHLISCFGDESKVFKQFKSRKLLSSCGNPDDDITWSSKFTNYCDALEAAFETHLMTTSSFNENLTLLRKSKEVTREQAAFCNGLIVYVNAYDSFIFTLRAKNTFYRKLTQLGLQLLEKLDLEESQNRSQGRYGLKLSKVESPRGLSSWFSLLSPRK